MKKLAIILVMALLTLSIPMSVWAAPPADQPLCTGSAPISEMLSTTSQGCPASLGGIDINDLLINLKSLKITNLTAESAQDCILTSSDKIVSCYKSIENSLNSCIPYISDILNEKTKDTVCDTKSASADDMSNKAKAQAPDSTANACTAANTAGGGNQGCSGKQSPKQALDAADVVITPEETTVLSTPHHADSNSKGCAAANTLSKINLYESAKQCGLYKCAEDGSCDTSDDCNFLAACEKLYGFLNSLNEKISIRTGIFKIIRNASQCQFLNQHGEAAPDSKNDDTAATPPSCGDTTTPPAGNDTTTPPAGNDTKTPPAGNDTTTPPAGNDTTTPPTGSNDNLSFEEQVVYLVNDQRSANGLTPLSLNAKLSDVARAKSQDMHDMNYFSHTSPTYGSPFDMMKAFGITYRAAGENIAMGYSTPQAVVNGWMNSPGHRANILNGSFTEIGVGYVSDGNYWTQMFIG